MNQDNRPKTQHTLEHVKRQAKQVKKDQGITHTQALEVVAKSLGFLNYAHCVNVLSDFKKTI